MFFLRERVISQFLFDMNLPEISRTDACNLYRMFLLDQGRPPIPFYPRLGPRLKLVRRLRSSTSKCIEQEAFYEHEQVNRRKVTIGRRLRRSTSSCIEPEKESMEPT